MRCFAGLVLVAVLAGGCTDAQNKNIAGGAKATAGAADKGKEVLNSPAAQTIAVATGTEPLRQTLVWGLTGLSALATAVGGMFAKRARTERKKKRAYKAELPQAGLDAANRKLYGAKFKPELSVK
jgi:hypothetical protein